MPGLTPVHLYTFSILVRRLTNIVFLPLPSGGFGGGGGGRRAFGTGYRRDEGGQDSYRQDSYRPDSYRRDDYRVSGDRYGDRGSDRYERREESRDDRGEKV